MAQGDGGRWEKGGPQGAVDWDTARDVALEFAHPESSGSEPPLFVEKVQVRARPTTRVVESAFGADHAMVEQFRVLKAKVAVLGESHPFRCIGITSPLGGEGKTTVALGLAAALAEEPGRRVLLIEGDLRKPSAERYLHLPGMPGLSEWLRARGDEVALRRVVPPGIFLLSAGLAALVRHDLMSVERMTALLKAAGEQFDWVLLDCPPLVSTADSIRLQDAVDGFLLVVRARRTPREMVTKALSLLKPDRVQGIVFNDHRELLTRYGYGCGAR